MLPVSEKYNELGTCCMGKVGELTSPLEAHDPELMLESGRVKKGDKLLLMPNKTDVEIAGIYTEQADEMEQAFAGDNIRLRLRGINDEDIQPGEWRDQGSVLG